MQTQCPTRKNLKRHQNRLERDFPSFQFTVTTGEQIEPRHMREIIAVNRLRMAEKGKVARFDETRVDWIIDLARQRGMMTLVRIDGRICAGAVTLRLGYTLVSHVNAHDPLYNDYRMGMLCCFMTICAGIEPGAKRFDFLCAATNTRPPCSASTRGFSAT